MGFPVPWQTSEQRMLESPLAVPELMKVIQRSIDFEGNTTAVDHLIAGSGTFIGSTDLSKHTFMIFCRHGSQGTPFFARVAMGEVRSNGSGSQIRYQFTLRPWDRFFVLIGLLMFSVFTALMLFALIVQPGSDNSAGFVITACLLLFTWFTPRIFQWKYRDDETKIESHIRKLASQ